MLSGRTIVVTGAARGVGRAIAQACARANASLVLGDILEEGGEAPPAPASMRVSAAQGAITPAIRQNLEAALRELLECDRVLTTLRAPAETALGE